MMMNCWCCFYVFYGCLITQLKEHKCQLNKAEEIIYMLRGMEDISFVSLELLLWVRLISWKSELPTAAWQLSLKLSCSAAESQCFCIVRPFATHRLAKPLGAGWIWSFACFLMLTVFQLSLQGEKDWQKYETARRLKKCVDKIRNQYREDWKSKEMKVRQRAVALYFIDKVRLVPQHTPLTFPVLLAALRNAVCLFLRQI